MSKKRIAFLSLLGATYAATAHVALASPGVATLDLQPVVTQMAAAMHVVQHLPPGFIANGQTLSLAFSTMAPAYRRTADTINGLTAEDQLGPLPLIGPTREGGEDVWRADRAIRGGVTLRYLVPAAPHDVPHSGPITYLQNTAGGLSGSFVSFLLVPRSETPLDIAVRWHLSPGERAISNVQSGDFRQRTTFAKLGETLFIAGPLVYAPNSLSNHSLIVAALGRPQAEVNNARHWFGRAFSAMRAAFHAVKVVGYRIMVFSHDRQAFDSGASKAGGFLYFSPANARLDDTKNHPIIAHEMVHSLAARYHADTDAAGDWYNEGLADYAAIIVPHAAGLYTPREYLDLVNEEAAFYYLNSRRQTPNDQISAVKWSANGAWSLGYTRGALYFANLDAGLRGHGSRTTVLDLIHRMNVLAAAHPIGPDDWERLLGRYAGPWAVSEWRAMLAGQLLQPVPGAFGKCLVARVIVTGHYELGINQSNLGEGDDIEQVVPGSNAFNAGLRDGDILREAFNKNGSDNNYDRQLTLKVVRDGKILDITYLPRAGTEQAYRWFAQSGNPDHPCIKRATSHEHINASTVPTTAANHRLLRRRRHPGCIQPRLGQGTYHRPENGHYPSKEGLAR